MADTPEAAAREVAGRIMLKLRWGEPLTRLLPADIASAVRDDITAALLSFRRAALEDESRFVVKCAFADFQTTTALFDELGRVVRRAWVRWALTQGNPKPAWLVPFEELSPDDQEADRQIGIAVARWTMGRLFHSPKDKAP